MVKVGMIHVVLAWLLLCAGCSTTRPRDPIRSESLKFMQAGVTTRVEVVDNLGSPARVLEPARVLVYEWEEWPPRGRYRRGRPYRSYDSQRLHRDVYHHISALCVACDTQWRVERYKFFEADASDELDKEIANWLKEPPK